MDEQSAFDQMAAALHDHQITDQEGNLVEATTSENSATQETNTVTETTKPEKANQDQTLSQEEDDSEESPAVDDTGKRYVPENRLKKETAKRREAERQAEALKTFLASQQFPVTDEKTKAETKQTEPDSAVEKLELRMVLKEYPQFNPNSEEYNQTLDSLAGNIKRANPGMSVMDAAEEALKTARRITEDQVKVAREARTVKAQQSDQGITSRVLNRSAETVDIDKMSLDEKEAYLRSIGQW